MMSNPADAAGGRSRLPDIRISNLSKRFWSYDFVEAQTNDGGRVRLLTLIDEFPPRGAAKLRRMLDAITIDKPALSEKIRKPGTI